MNSQDTPTVLGGIRRIVFDVDSLLALLTHYSDGAVPLDAEVLNIGASRLLGRYIGLTISSADWRDPDLPRDRLGMLPPLDIRWEGGKVLKWSEKGTPVEWGDSPDALKRS